MRYVLPSWRSLILVGLLLLGGGAVAMATPSPVLAQDYSNVDDPTDLNYGFGLGSIRCISLRFWRDSFPVRPDCIGDMREEDLSRQEAAVYDRWIAAAVMTYNQLRWGIDQLQNMIQETRALERQVRSIFAGFDRSVPERTVTRIAAATDRFESRINQIEMQDAHYHTTALGTRYDWLDRLAQRSLMLAQSAQENASDVSEQTMRMQARLSEDGQIQAVTIGEGEEMFALRERPPLANDAPAGADHFYNTYSGAARPGTAQASGMAFASSGTSAVPEGVASVVSMDLGPAMMAAFDNAGASLVCEVDPDGTDDPAVIFQRVQAQAAGAQGSAHVVSGDVREHREQLRAIRAREESSLWEMFMEALIRWFESW